VYDILHNYKNQALSESKFCMDPAL